MWYAAPAAGWIPAALAILAGMIVGAGGCSPDPDGGDRLRLVAGFYPLQFVAARVGGDRVAVSSLAKPGAEPHDLELTSRQVAEIADADLVIYLAGFQPAVDEAVRQEAADSALDAAEIVPLIDLPFDGDPAGAGTGAATTPPSAAGDGAKDPHLWLDPTRLAVFVDALAERLAGIDPGSAAGYRTRAADVIGRLARLDAEYTAGLRSCQRREIVVSHAAFGYLADRYDLDQVAISGRSPDVEPTPQRLATVTAEASRLGATTIFFEPLAGSRVVAVVAAEIGATTAVLDPIEGPPDDPAADYFSVMRANLATLEKALGCS